MITRDRLTLAHRGPCQSDYDQDGDGYISADFTGDDCNDTNPDFHPDAEDIPYDNKDQDCDGFDLLDADGDGYDAASAGGDDCDDDDPATYPGAPEDGTTVDRNCDGYSDTKGKLKGRSCGCTSAPSPSGAWLLLLGLVGLRRRRS